VSRKNDRAQMPVPFLRCIRCGRRVKHEHGDGLHCQPCAEIIARLKAER